MSNENVPFLWKMLTKPETCPLARQREVNQHHHAQDDAVNAEGGEGVPPHIFHQSPDDQQAHQERHHAPHDQHADLGAGGGDAAEQELQPLDGGRPQHGGDGHEEGEFRAGAASHADEDCAYRRFRRVL